MIARHWGWNPSFPLTLKFSPILCLDLNNAGFQTRKWYSSLTCVASRLTTSSYEPIYEDCVYRQRRKGKHSKALLCGWSSLSHPGTMASGSLTFQSSSLEPVDSSPLLCCTKNSNRYTPLRLPIGDTHSIYVCGLAASNSLTHVLWTEQFPQAKGAFCNTMQVVMQWATM